MPCPLACVCPSVPGVEIDSTSRCNLFASFGTKIDRNRLGEFRGAHLEPGISISDSVVCLVIDCVGRRHSVGARLPVCQYSTRVANHSRHSSSARHKMPISETVSR